jgi:hypothetical protein
MAYNLFDAPPANRDKSTKKINQAFNHASQKAALKAMLSYVIPGGTAGTAITVGSLAGLDVGSTATKFKLTNPVLYTINGSIYKQAALDEILYPAALGTQGTACICKYLVYCGVGALATTSGKVAKGNEGTAAGDCKLPDLPDNSCPLGYVTVTTTTAGYVAGTGTMGQGGISATYADLITMPVE